PDERRIKVHQALPGLLVVRLDPLQKAQGSQVPGLVALGHPLLLGRWGGAARRAAPRGRKILSHPVDYNVRVRAGNTTFQGHSARGGAWVCEAASGRRSKNWPPSTSAICRKRAWRPSASTWKAALVAKRFWTAWTTGPTRPSPPCVIPD